MNNLKNRWTEEACFSTRNGSVIVLTEEFYSDNEEKWCFTNHIKIYISKKDKFEEIEEFDYDDAMYTFAEKCFDLDNDHYLPFQAHQWWMRDKKRRETEENRKSWKLNSTSKKCKKHGENTTTKTSEKKIAGYIHSTVKLPRLPMTVLPKEVI